jgi:hypothetical protein
VNLASKLQLRPRQRLEIVSPPDGLIAVLGALNTNNDERLSTALLVFVPNADALEERRALITAAATTDRLTWVAYPKAGQLGTDLNRDSLAARLLESGIQPVRQIALDDVWSALRFRASE